MASSCDVTKHLAGDGPYDWIARLQLLPDDCRNFSIDSQRATREFGIDPTALGELIAAGLPHVETEAELRFSECDLHYLALRLGCTNPHLRAMSWWAQSLEQAARSDALEAVVRCMAYAAVGTEIDFRDHLGQRSTRIEGDHCVAKLEFTTITDWPSFDPAILDLLEEIASLDFCWIPHAIEDPVALARRTGLADCVSAAGLLVQECHLRGIPARTAFGLLLAAPYSTPHSWAETLIEDRWVPADPLLLALLVRHTTLDGTQWPPTRSPGGVFLRFTENQQPLATIGGESTSITFLTALRGSTGSHCDSSGARSAIGTSDSLSDATAQ